MHIYKDVQIYLHICMHIYVYICTYICTNIYTYIKMYECIFPYKKIMEQAMNAKTLACINNEASEHLI